MNDFLKNIFRMALFILIQVYVLNKIHLHRFIVPYLYYLPQSTCKCEGYRQGDIQQCLQQMPQRRNKRCVHREGGSEGEETG